TTLLEYCFKASSLRDRYMWFLIAIFIAKKLIVFPFYILKYYLCYNFCYTGANPYCIDTNYGGWLIIWDRMFGTFQEEREDEKITYGTIDQKPTFHIVLLQFTPMMDLYNRIRSQATLGDKV
ncbi:unnamed protein product, partial [Meganyctiphanes norvegica]